MVAGLMHPCLPCRNPADCQLADTWGCFQGWPDAQAMPAVTHVYLLVELGWYLHLLPKYQLGEMP